MNAVPIGKQATVAFEVDMAAYIATHLVVHTWVSYGDHCWYTEFVAFEVCITICRLIHLFLTE